MPTLKESLESKVESLGVGALAHLHDLFFTNTGDGVSAKSIWNDPRIYKPIFSLDKLGIEKSLKSVVMEVRDSVARVYYILDSSCFFIDFDCDYQVLEVVKEQPVEVTHYLKILCSKKGRLELIVRQDNLYLLFQDTFPSKMPAKEKKEKEVDKYVLSIPFKEVTELDKDVIEFVKEVINLGGSFVDKNSYSLPIDLTTITLNKEPVDYWGLKVPSKYGDFIVVDTSGICTTLVICPTLVSKNFLSSTSKEVVHSLNDKEIQELQDDVDLVNTFMEIEEND